MEREPLGDTSNAITASIQRQQPTRSRRLEAGTVTSRKKAKADEKNETTSSSTTRRDPLSTSIKVRINSLKWYMFDILNDIVQTYYDDATETFLDEHAFVSKCRGLVDAKKARKLIESKVASLGYRLTRGQSLSPSSKYKLYITGEYQNIPLSQDLYQAVFSLKSILQTFADNPTVIQRHWHGLYHVSTLDYQGRRAQQYTCVFCVGATQVTTMSRCKYAARAKADRNIWEARMTPEEERTPSQKVWAQQIMHFVDQDGNFDKKAASEARQDDHVCLETAEKSLINEMFSPSKGGAIVITASDAVGMLLKSQQSMFGEASGGMFLSTISKHVLEELDTVDDLDSIDKRINDLAQVRLQQIVAGTGFKLSSTMTECRNDESMPALVRKIIGDGTDHTAINAYDATTVEIAVKLSLVLVEKECLIGVVAGRIRVYVRENGRVAMWARLPENLRKFYCIGTCRLYNLTHRAYDYKLDKEITYIVDLNGGQVLLLRRSPRLGRIDVKRLKVYNKTKGNDDEGDNISEEKEEDEDEDGDDDDDDIYDEEDVEDDIYDDEDEDDLNEDDDTILDTTRSKVGIKIKDHDGEYKRKLFHVSHLVTKSLDHSNTLFEPTQRWAIFRGYVRRNDKKLLNFYRTSRSCVLFMTLFSCF